MLTKQIAMERLPLALQSRDRHREALLEIMGKIGGEIYGFKHKFIPAQRKQELLGAYKTIHQLWEHEHNRIEELCEVLTNEVALPDPDEFKAHVCGKWAINLEKLASELDELRADYFTGADNQSKWEVDTRDMIVDLVARIKEHQRNL